MGKKEEFKKIIGEPLNYEFEKQFIFLKKYELSEFDCEVYKQANGVRPDGTVTFQKVIIAYPKNISGKLPGVVIPFYFPEAAMGFDPESSEYLEKYSENPTMLDIVKHGYVTISAESYHLTYAECYLEKTDFKRWDEVAKIFNQEHPEWSGVGKLIADTKLLIDVLEKDSRVDSEKIGIAGHSLGGKIAFLTGCFDDRIKVILASDFGIAWHQTNWDAPWYWGNKINTLKEQNLENIMLLKETDTKPFCLIAGKFDTDESRKIIYSLDEYKNSPEKVFIVNHRAGHRPPKYAVEAGYYFLDEYLK